MNNQNHNSIGNNNDIANNINKKDLGRELLQQVNVHDFKHQLQLQL